MNSSGRQPLLVARALLTMKACQDAMARHDQMLKEMATMDTRLQEQVKAMQSAQG